MKLKITIEVDGGTVRVKCKQAKLKRTYVTMSTPHAIEYAIAQGVQKALSKTQGPRPADVIHLEDYR